MPTSRVNLDTTQYVKVNSQQASITLQSLRDSIRVALSSIKPSVDNTVFHTLGADDNPLQFTNIETDVWALSVTETSGLVVTETATSGKSGEYSVDVALGNIPGVSSTVVTMRNPVASNTGYFDVWSGGGDMVMPTAAETWTIESDSALDTNITGTGAWSVRISSLDIGYDIQSTLPVALNGLTPVDIDGTHYRTHQLASTSAMIVLTAGSTHTNQGTLTVKDKATGNIRMRILPLVGKSSDGHISVPNGFTLLGLSLLNLWEKDQAGSFSNFVTPSTDNAATIQTGIFPAYQNTVSVLFQSKFRTDERTDRIFKAQPINNGVQVTIVQEFYLVENAVADPGSIVLPPPLQFFI